MVIATRYKKVWYIEGVFAILLFSLILFLEIKTDDYSVKGIFALICGFAFFIISMYFMLSPKNAILKKGDCLVFNYLFKKKTIRIKDIEYVSYHERGEIYNRKHDLFSYMRFFRDVRFLTVSYKENGLLKHKSLMVENAQSVKTEIDCLIDKA